MATVPVSDIDRTRNFYAEKLGFNVDIDRDVGEGARLLQLTPPGSAASIHLGKETTDMKSGDLDGLILVVTDVRAARAILVERGVEVGDSQVLDKGAFRPATEDENLDYVGYVFFSDPDENGWVIQQMPARYREENEHGQSGDGKPRGPLEEPIEV